MCRRLKLLWEATEYVAKCLAALGARSPRTVSHGGQPASRVLRYAPALRTPHRFASRVGIRLNCPRYARSAFTSRTVTRGRQPAGAGPLLRAGPLGDCRGRPCGKPSQASRKAGLLVQLYKCDVREPRSVVAEDRSGRTTRAFSAAGGGQRPCRQRLRGADRDQVVVIPKRRASKRVPSRSIAQATLSRRSATERRARACPWPRARNDRYFSWLTGSRWAAIRAQW